MDVDVRAHGPALLEDRDLPASGSGAVAVARVGHRSLVTRAFATSPLRLLTPRNHGRGAWIYTATYGGGLVDGDQIRLDVDVGAGAAAFLSSQASTKVYRSPSGTSSTVDASVADDALLVVAPDPVVCFAKARYAQTQRFALADGAALAVVDWLTAGRRAMGERWMFDRVETRLTIHRQGRLLVHDALSLRAADGDLAARMARFEVLCTIVIVGAALRAHVAALLKAFVDLPVASGAATLTGASPLGEDGCVVRIAGVALEPVAHAVRDHLRFLQAVLGDDPWTGKW